MLDGALTLRLERLTDLLHALVRVAVAVSGGVDSLTLALLAGRVLTTDATMFHAVSPAVPADATRRVQAMAEQEGWRLKLVNAGEFADEDYRRNPYERCFHCKKHLYATLAANCAGVLVSGANLDDLQDFRPGLEAAASFSVRHPFVECGIDKAALRAICRHLGYPVTADLPAAPCLSSRIETGLRIEPALLAFVEQVESTLRARLPADLVRCRVRPTGVAIQLDPQVLEHLPPRQRDLLAGDIRTQAQAVGLPTAICFEHYAMGSSFVRRS